jgi:hypothetical protein
MDHLEWLPEVAERTIGAWLRGAPPGGTAPEEEETMAPLVASREVAEVVMVAAEVGSDGLGFSGGGGLGFWWVGG